MEKEDQTKLFEYVKDLLDISLFISDEEKVEFELHLRYKDLIKITDSKM